MNDTIELWEAEIAEANRYHFFANINKEIDFLCESIKMDFKLQEMGIITEAEDEPKQSIPVRVINKIKAVIKRIIDAIDELLSKLYRYINDKQRNANLSKFEKQVKAGKINEIELADKLNSRMYIFDPDKYDKEFIEPINKVSYTSFENMELSDEETDRIKELADGINKIQLNDLDAMQQYKIDVRYQFNQGNAGSDLISVLNKTNDNLRHISNFAKHVKTSLEKEYRTYWSAKANKLDKVTYQKVGKYIDLLESVNKIIQRSLSLHIKQNSFLLNVTRQFIKNNAIAGEDD